MTKSSKKSTVLNAGTFVETVLPSGIHSFKPDAAMQETLKADFEKAGFVFGADGKVDLNASQLKPTGIETAEPELLTDGLEADLIAEGVIVPCEPELETLKSLDATTPAETVAPPATETVTPPATLETMIVSLDQIAASLDLDVVGAKAQSIVNEFDAREIAERQKNLDNDSIVKSLRKSRSKLGSLTAAAVLIAASVDEGFINRTIHTGAAYNVYAIDKVADIVAALGGSTMKNAINIAVMKSMFKFRAAGLSFTGEMAKCCASDKIRIAASLSKELVRYTVSASTAPTQASSTMQALQTLGVVINKGSPKLPVYELTDTPATTRLQSLLAA